MATDVALSLPADSEAENEAKGEIQRTMSRAMAEAQIWKAKYTTEAVARIEDLENARSKLLVILIKRQDWLKTFGNFDKKTRLARNFW